MQIPVQLLGSLQDVPGFDEAAFKAVHASGEQVTSIRINPKKISGPEIITSFVNSNYELSPIPWCPEGYYLNERPIFTFDPLLHAGAYYVQEASSMFLSYILESLFSKTEPKLVLDLCAAPGGKSTLLSSFFENGLVVSNEVIKSRAGILRENIIKWGNANVVLTSNDSKDFSNLHGFFDVIITDVPCSGSGLFRKDPGAIEEWSPGNVILSCQRQKRILADIIPCLKQDGILVYSTCSYSKEEDENILDWIADEYNLESLSVQVPGEWNIIESSSEKYGAKGYRFFPDKLKGEGFFIAALRQPAGPDHRKFREASTLSATAKETDLLSGYIVPDPAYTFFKHAEVFNIFPSYFLVQLRILANTLYIKQAGIAAGSFKGKSFVPEHALALSTIKHHFPRVSLSKEEALSYLRKQDIKTLAPEGWCLITYLGIGLGWIKNLQNRTNNYYPSEWRILKS